MGRRAPFWMSGLPRRASLLPLAVAVALLLTLGAVLLAGCGDPGGTQASPPATPSPTPSLSAAQELDLVQTAFDGAVVALQAGDLEAWRAALPGASPSVTAIVSPSASAAVSPNASTAAPPDVTADASASSTDVVSPSPLPLGLAVTDVKAVREDLDEVFAHLAPLPLRAAHAVVRAFPGRPHFYWIRFTALIGRAGPADRVLAERIWQVQVDPAVIDAAAGGSAVPATAATAPVSIVADVTPVELVRENVMAFNTPRSLVRKGFVLVYERAWRLRAANLAPLTDAARAHVAAKYGVDAGRAAVVFLYASRDQVMLALAALPGQVDSRIKYFSHPPPRVANRLWSPTDVGVVAPALNGREDWAPYMLQHEVAHSYTMGWFFDTAHAPVFLEEGLAVAAEESHDWSGLKAALASGGLDPALADAIALDDIWSGRKTEDVRVLYSAGGSLVDFILQRWGRSELRRWVGQVSDSDLSREAIARVTRRRFGVNWPAFVSQWRAYVEQL